LLRPCASAGRAVRGPVLRPVFCTNIPLTPCSPCRRSSSTDRPAACSYPANPRCRKGRDASARRRRMQASAASERCGSRLRQRPALVRPRYDGPPNRRPELRGKIASADERFRTHSAGSSDGLCFGDALDHVRSRRLAMHLPRTRSSDRVASPTARRDPVVEACCRRHGHKIASRGGSVVVTACTLLPRRLDRLVRPIAVYRVARPTATAYVIVCGRRCERRPLTTVFLRSPTAALGSWTRVEVALRG
jgi:hypothetical protein